MTVSGHPSARRVPRRRAVSMLLERRGVVGTLLTPIRWLLAPVVQYGVVQFFEWRVDDESAPATGPVDVSVEIFHGLGHSRGACVALCRLEQTSPENIDTRLARGDRVAVARSDGEVLGYAWSAYSDLPMSEIDAVLRVGPKDFVGYDGYVVEGARGRGILPLLDRAQIADAQRLGRTRQLVYASSRNRSVHRSMEKSGKRRLLKVAFLHIPLARARWKIGLGGDLSEYFTE